MGEEENLTMVRVALPRFILRGVSGASFGKTFPIFKTTTLGRHSECEITLSGDGLSRRHAELSIEGAALRVKDLGSANGTYVNDNRVEEASLGVGDELRLDNVRFLVQSPDSKAELPPTPAPSPPAPVRWVPWAVGATVALALLVVVLLLTGVI